MPSPAPDPDAALLARDPIALAARLRDISPEAAARPGDVRVVHAPGRVNLIGEHTDYNEGLVLPVGVTFLRDVTPAMLEAARPRLDPVVAAPAEHIVHENARVLAAVDAFEAGDIETMDRLFDASHASMRDLFGISSPELDAPVEIAAGVPGVIGARLTGPGFGGCTINLVRRDAVDDLREAIMRDYPVRTGLAPPFFEVAPSDGVRRIA